MNYVPQIKSANPKNHSQLGSYSAVLLGDIESLALPSACSMETAAPIAEPLMTGPKKLN